MGSQRVGHDWATELNWTELKHYYNHLKENNVWNFVQLHIYIWDTWMPSLQIKDYLVLLVIVVQSPSGVRFFVTPWTSAHQASLSLTISESLPKCISIESMRPYICLILCCPFLPLPSIFPSIRVFSNELAVCIASAGQNIGASASASVLPMSIQLLFSLRLTGFVSARRGCLWWQNGDPHNPVELIVLEKQIPL